MCAFDIEGFQIGCGIGGLLREVGGDGSASSVDEEAVWGAAPPRGGRPLWRDVLPEQCACGAGRGSRELWSSEGGRLVYNEQTGKLIRLIKLPCNLLSTNFLASAEALSLAGGSVAEVQGNLSPDLLEQAMDDMQKARWNLPRAAEIHRVSPRQEVQRAVVAHGMV